MVEDSAEKLQACYYVLIKGVVEADKKELEASKELLAGVPLTGALTDGGWSLNQNSRVIKFVSKLRLQQLAPFSLS